MPESVFLIFRFFFYFCRIFLPGSYERNLGLKFFCPFFCLSHPVLAKKNAGKRFFNFLIFLLFFSVFSCPGRIRTEFGIKIFVLSFSASINPFWIEIMPDLTFLIFWIFLLFFLEFSSSGWVWTEFGTKIFFSLFRPISSRFG